MNHLQNKLSILIIDDSKDNIMILSSMLNQDYEICASSSSEQALSIAFSVNPPDLILLNVCTPGIDGFELCRNLKASQQTTQIPIIFITDKRDIARLVLRRNHRLVC